MGKVVMDRTCPRCGKPMHYTKAGRGFRCESPYCGVHRVRYEPGTFHIIEILESAIPVRDMAVHSRAQMRGT